MGADTASLEQLWVDREADVPIGVQLTWAIKMQIDDGTLRAGHRLPGLRDLAEALAVNPNTVRAVYSKLERDGLLESRQGSGTFVAPGVDCAPRARAIAARAAREALKAGLDPREVASVLYVQASQPQAAKSDAKRRSSLRAQITTLEQALGELEAEHPALAHSARQRHPASSARERAGLPSAEELEQIKSSLLRRLGPLQAEIDALQRTDTAEQPPGRIDTPTVAKAPPAASRTRKTGGRGTRTPHSRPAPAGA
jgi:DNA-binding transcriptional regulator YhcF (GntR family)